jgi:hypothetical protein
VNAAASPHLSTFTYVDLQRQRHQLTLRGPVGGVAVLWFNTCLSSLMSETSGPVGYKKRVCYLASIGFSFVRIIVILSQRLPVDSGNDLLNLFSCFQKPY